jgi:hypothetical protein
VQPEVMAAASKRAQVYAWACKAHTLQYSIALS